MKQTLSVLSAVLAMNLFAPLAMADHHENGKEHACHCDENGCKGEKCGVKKGKKKAKCDCAHKEGAAKDAAAGADTEQKN